MEYSNDVWSPPAILPFDEAEPVRIYRDRTSAQALARRHAAVKREIFFWRAMAVVCLLGFNIAVALILQDLGR